MSRSRSKTRDHEKDEEEIKLNVSYQLSDQHKQWIATTIKSPWFYVAVFAVLTWFHEDSPVETATSMALLMCMYVTLHTVTWSTGRRDMLLSIAKVIAYVVAFYVVGFLFTFIKLHYDLRYAGFRYAGLFAQDLGRCKALATADKQSACFYAWISNNHWYFYKYASTWPMAALKMCLKDPLLILKNVLFQACKHTYVWIIMHSI